MSITRTLTITHRVDNVLTDLSSVPVLRDPTLVFGVKAVISGAILVPANTPFIRDSLGIYSYDLTGLTSGTQYTAWVERVYGGETKRSQIIWVASAIMASGLYADETDLDDLRGIDNITSWSDLENTGVRNSTRIQRCFNTGDTTIEKELERVYSFPLANLGSADTELLSVWSSVITAYLLYTNRGLNQLTASGRTAGNPFKEEYRGVMDDIWLYANNKRTLRNNKLSGSSTRIRLGHCRRPRVVPFYTDIPICGR